MFSTKRRATERFGRFPAEILPFAEMSMCFFACAVFLVGIDFTTAHIIFSFVFRGLKQMEEFVVRVFHKTTSKRAFWGHCSRIANASLELLTLRPLPCNTTIGLRLYPFGSV